MKRPSGSTSSPHPATPPLYPARTPFRSASALKHLVEEFSIRPPSDCTPPQTAAPLWKLPWSTGGLNYEGVLDGNTATSTISWFVTASLTNGVTETTTTTTLQVADNLSQIVDDFETGLVGGWSVVTDASVTAGAWELANPNGTVSGGIQSQPEDPASGNFCWITGNGAVGVAGSADLDGGPTHLISPSLNLAGTDATIRFNLWYANIESDPSQLDDFVVSVSNDGGATWNTALVVGGALGTGSAWQNFEFTVSDIVTPSANIQVRFTASDAPNNSLCEAGVDDFTIEEASCNGTGAVTFQRGDVNLDGSRDIGDPVSMLQACCSTRHQ